MDGVINCLVVMFMNERYNALYIGVCGPCRLCQSVVLQCCCNCTYRKHDDSKSITFVSEIIPVEKAESRGLRHLRQHSCPDSSIITVVYISYCSVS